MKKSIFILLLPAIITSCVDAQGWLHKLGNIQLKEASGLEYDPVTKSIWVNEDSGNKNELYELDGNGKIIQTIKITNVKNNDWEDLAFDIEGNLYIGDFGNNENERDNLAIYKINKQDLHKDKTKASAIISFTYPEQADLPPKKKERIFDAEAFFEYKGNFYLFTKNRSSKFNGDFSVYKIPNKEGNHKAKLLGTLNTCDAYRKCAITAADISPGGKYAILLSGDKIWKLEGFAENDFSKAVIEGFDLGHFSQKEGVCFKDDDTLLIVDEKEKKTGGKLYEVNLSALKAKP